MIKYIVSAVIAILFFIADVYIFMACGGAIGLAMVILEGVAMARLKYELRGQEKEG